MSVAGEPDYSPWLGRTETVSDHMCPTLVERLRATLGYPAQPLAAGDALPAAWHWMLCTPAVMADGLGEDGHPARGGFLPPVELPRRMWVGGELRFERPLPVGADVERRSTIAAIEPKSGRSGRLCFVTVEHEYRVGGKTALGERQNIVYREPSPPGTASAPPPPPEVKDDVVRSTKLFDAVMLFRYSALTFNGHRIHYDADYTRDVEGYPGLVVHGPLMATLLMAHVCDKYPGCELARFAYRIESPVFLGDSIELCAGVSENDGVKAWVENNGGLVLGAEAVLREV